MMGNVRGIYVKVCRWRPRRLFEFRLWQHGGQQLGVGHGVRGARCAGGSAGSAGGGAGSGGRGRVHWYHVHVRELLARNAVVVLLLLLLLLQHLSEPTLDGIVVAGWREQVVWWGRRLGLVVAAVVLSVVPDAVHVTAQVTGVRQFNGAARVDGIAEEKFGARDHEEEEHQATERG